jgi:hypothetical protein
MKRVNFPYNGPCFPFAVEPLIISLSLSSSADKTLVVNGAICCFSLGGILGDLLI